MRVTIYQPTKNAMQSGRGRGKGWVLEPEMESLRRPESLMGWTEAGDTLSQLRNKLTFETQEAATQYAEKMGWAYTVLPTQARRVTPRSYLDNFKRKSV